MPLPTPNLDDRDFQDLVDDAKRLVQQRCPEWTDHNVSDPGVTLIEAFAQMVDQLIYRLNRVPERHYIKFLDLLGVELFPPTAATGTVTFWLAAPQPAAVVVRAETEVATPRTDTEEAVVFGTVGDLQIVPCELHRVASQPISGDAVDQTSTLEYGHELRCFSEQPRPGEALLIGLSRAVPACAVVLRFDCPVGGVGIDPRNPPLVWEAWNGAGWTACEVERDETGGFNRPGDVLLHVPTSHRTELIARQRAGWLRCRIVPTARNQPEYTASPRIAAIRAFTIGGTVGIVHAETIHDEILGVSDGAPGQRFALQRRPVLRADRPTVLRVSDEAAGGGWTEWLPVADFARSAEHDRHYRLDPVAGEVQFGPAVRQPDGGLRQYGAVLPKGSTLRMSAYRVGGGSGGNIARGLVRVLKTSVPYIARVENRRAVSGGVEGETVDNAKLRGPLELRSSGRAVTAEDFEELARTAAPDAARVRCVAVGEGSDASAVRLLVVPKVTPDSMGRLPDEELRRPPTELLQRIKMHLDACRLIGTRLVVAPPVYHGITVVAQLRAQPPAQADDVRRAAVQALYDYLSPLTGGPERTGWPFGRSVQAFDISAVLAAVPGVATIDEVLIFPAELTTGQRGEPAPRVNVGKDALVMSYQHQVRVR
jgi:predicted phage baseplate assembly protein